MRRREFLGAIGGGLAWPMAVNAQQATPIRKIAVLMGFPEADPQAQAIVVALRQELQRLGWIDGRNVRIDTRWAGADPDKARAFARELIGMAPDVIVPCTNQVTRIVQQETRTIPVVFAFVGDPVGSGFAMSLSRPGRNITGFANLEGTMAGKWLQLLTEIAPAVKRVAVMFNPDMAPGRGSFYLTSFEAAARLLNVEPIVTPIHSDAEIETVITSRWSALFRRSILG